ncbi:Calx-beta domain-containing protein, partial [Actinoplanes sp. NPDC051633]|uniref:Calx-beta domain-containing protein n=1 Tax=Actinoplanes sp. NPDC051633 TaxID=3155670 RepID=UPI003426A041
PTSLTPTILGGASATPTVNLGQIDFADDDIDENNETVLATLTDPAQEVTIATVSATQTITDNDASPTFAVGDYPFAEGDGEVDIPVDQVFDQNVSATERTMTVHYATQDGTAKENDDDYDGVSGTLTFTGGGPTSKPVKVDIEDDLIFETDETFTVKLSSPTPAGAVISKDTGTMTVQDDDSGRKPTFTVSAPATAVSETTTTANVTINVSPKTTQDIDFVVSAEADLATSGQAGPGGSDYTVGTTAKVLAGTTSVTVPVTILNDTVYEGAETATIKIALAGGETDADTNFPDKSTTFSIADNDNVPTVSLNAVGNRESQSVDVTGTVLGVAQRVVPITVTATGSLNGAGTDAAEPGDFSAAGLNVTEIPAGDQTGAAVPLGSITLADDRIDENPETVKVNLTVNSVAATPVYFLIADDAMDMTPTISVADAGVAEGTLNAQLTASLDFTAPGNDAEATEKTLGAHWATADGTAKAAEPDYTASSGNLTFANPDTDKTINVPITDDGLYELAEDFFVNLSAPTGTTISGASAKVTITDNDGSNKPTFSVTGSDTFKEGTAPGKVEYTVTMSPKNTQDVHFTVEVIGGTATQDDFATPTGTLTIPANATTGKIDLTVKNDVVYEPNETVILKVALDPAEIHAGGPAVQKTLSITDDDPKPTVTLVAESGAEGTDLVAAARVHGVSQTDTTFGLSFTGDATGGNNAAEASDFVDNHEAAMIPAGTEDGSLVTFRTFRLNNDTIDEPVETIRMVATNADGDVPSDPQYYRINDDVNDVPPSVTVGDLTVNEDDGTASVPVTLAFPPTTETTETEQAVTVNLATGDDTAASPSDYSPEAGPIKFDPGVDSSTFDVPIVDDSRNESDETFTVTATSVTPGNTPLAKSTGVVTIEDNDQNVSRPGFSVAPVSQFEGAAAGTATFTVTLADVAADDVTFTVGAADDTASDAGTGPGSNDYDPPSSSSVTVTQGVKTGQFSVPVNGDAVFEDEETMDVTVTLAEGERDAVGGPAATTLTIRNDDAHPTVRLSNASAYEGDQILLNGTVSGSTQDTTDAEVTFSGGESAEVDDYSLDGVTLEGAIPAGAVTGTPVSLGVLDLSDDTVDEPIETVQALSGTRTTTYRILDDPDDLPPTVSIGDATIGEDEDSVDLTISLNFSGDTTYTDYNVVVPWYTTDGNARAGYDYDASEGNALILAGTDSAEINVPINNDALYEGDQTFVVGLDTPQPSAVKNSDDTADVTIVEDDEPSAPTLTAPVSRPGQGLVTMTGTAGESATVVLWGAPGSLASGKFAMVATTQAN